jgi:invasion protein IalB
MKLKYLLLLVFFMVLPHSGASANEQKPTFFATPWSTKCQETPPSKEKVCVLEKYLFEDKNQKNRIGGIGVRTTNQDKNTVLTIISPLGVALSQGVEIGISGEKLTTQPFIFCDNGGCVSQFIANNKIISAMSDQKSLSLIYQLLNGRKVVINVDLENFKSLYNTIKQ